MAIVANTRDKILQAAAVRVVVLGEANILLQPEAQFFTVDAEGTPTFPSIKINAAVFGWEGPVQWMATNATLSNVGPRSADLPYASMVGDTATVIGKLMNGSDTIAENACLIQVMRVYNGAKTVKLLPSHQVFAINKSGTVTPSSLLLTAIGQNTVGTPSFTIPEGTATLSAGSNASQKILTYANMMSDVVSVEVTLDGQKDRVTVIKVREGQNGIDAINSFLTNESVTLPATSAGTVTSYAGADCAMRIYKGTVDDSANWTYTFSPLSDANRVTYTTTGGVTITGMAAGVDASYVDITASKTGATSITKRFSVSKSRAGAQGMPGSSTQRGSINLTKTIAGSAWSDVEANNAIYNAGYGSPVRLDVVTLNNPTTGFVQTRAFDSMNWYTFAQLIDGNQIVRGTIRTEALAAEAVTAEKIKAGAVTADRIDSRGLTVKKLDGTLLLGVDGLAAEALPAGTKNSEIVVGGRNLFPDGGFERGIHILSGANYDTVAMDASVDPVIGSKLLFMQGSGVDMYVYLRTRISVTPGREYRISFHARTATSGTISGSSSYLGLYNSSSVLVDHAHLPMDNLGVGTWKRQVVAWTCPPGITQVEPRFGIHTNGKYSWLAIDCLQIEEGNTVTQWTPATEDIAADAQAKADYAKNLAYGAAVEHTNNQLATKMNRGNDVLGGVIAVDVVNAPAGFRAGPLSWNAAGDYTSGYGTALTPKGLIGYNTAGRRTFMVNGQTGDVQLYGDLMGGAYTGADWPVAGGIGYFLGHAGLFLGNPSIGKYVRIGSDGNMYLPGFTHENGQLTLTNTVIVTPKLRSDFYVTVANLYLNSQVNTSSYQSFPVSVAKVNGLAPYRYNWSFQAEEGDISMGADPTNENGIVRARGTNRVCSGFMTCTVTDANGAQHSDSGYIRIQFGSGVPV